MMSGFLVMQWRTLVLDATVKALVLFGAAGLAVLCLRRASAASRHLVWLLTLGGLLALPFLSAMLPGWRLSLSPSALPVLWGTRLVQRAAAWRLIPQDAPRPGSSDLQPVFPPLAGVPGGGAKRGAGPRGWADYVRFAVTCAHPSGSGSGLGRSMEQKNQKKENVIQ